GEDGGAPAIDLPKIFSESGFGNFNNISNPHKDKKGKDEQTKKDGKKKYLTTYCHNLTEDARAGKLDNIIGREKELARVIQILLRRQKNNPCLIGEPGVGKTAIAEALAQKIAKGDVPYKLRNSEIYLVDLTALVAGTQFRGQFESRILGLLSEVKAQGNIILVIDEVHNIVGTGDAEGSMNAANIMKPALSRGEIQVIGATTLNEYRKYIEKDTALERRFQPVTVNEPSIDDSVKMLCGIKHYYEEYHGIKIPDDILKKAVVLSERYITDRYLPDKAIDLIDEAASHISLSSLAVNNKLKLEKEKEELIKEKEKCEALPDSSDEQQQAKYRELAAIKVEELRLEEDLDKATKECEMLEMTEENLAEVIEIWTGIPASSITENEFEKIDKLDAKLKERIIGQDKAVSAVTRAIK
ncbi:MAG: ATP-dependent Clp protease ATP-binding subunit, partial [Clostridia bacterium]|nr:ATP-dependent Clp protease ATP-binding subunit [Clostridia bacterium]